VANANHVKSEVTPSVGPGWLAGWHTIKAAKLNPPPTTFGTSSLPQLPPQHLYTMAPHDDHGHAYHPKDAIGESSRAAFKTGVIGAMFSGIQATLTKQNIGAFGAVTKYGGTMAMFGMQHCFSFRFILLLALTYLLCRLAATGATYTFVRDVTSNLREEDDWKSSMLGGFVAGGLVGVYSKHIPLSTRLVPIGSLANVCQIRTKSSRHHWPRCFIGHCYQYSDIYRWRTPL
jgi:hypothetical protein